MLHQRVQLVNIPCSASRKKPRDPDRHRRRGAGDPARPGRAARRGPGPGQPVPQALASKGLIKMMEFPAKPAARSACVRPHPGRAAEKTAVVRVHGVFPAALPGTRGNLRETMARLHADVMSARALRSRGGGRSAYLTLRDSGWSRGHLRSTAGGCFRDSRSRPLGSWPERDRKGDRGHVSPAEQRVAELGRWASRREVSHLRRLAAPVFKAKKDEAMRVLKGNYKSIPESRRRGRTSARSSRPSSSGRRSPVSAAASVREQEELHLDGDQEQGEEAEPSWEDKDRRTLGTGDLERIGPPAASPTRS